MHTCDKLRIHLLFQMPRQLHDQEKIISALSAIRRGMSYRKAAAMYGIPRDTLFKRNKGIYPVVNTAPGLKPKMGFDLEA